jgi:hypothetical protein
MIPAGGQQSWDECHLVIQNMATLSPFWDSEWRLHRHFAIGLTRMTPLQSGNQSSVHQSNESGKLRPLVGHNHKAIYRKNEYTTRRSLFDGRGVVSQGQNCVANSTIRDAYRMFRQLNLSTDFC